MKIIEVIPNPYIALDKDGVPQGVVGAGMPGVFIGAQIDLVASRLTGKNRYYFPLGKTGGRHKVKLSVDVVTAVREGSLIAADEKAAALCGIFGEEFLPPEEAMEEEREKALAYYRAALGEDAEVQDIPREPTPAPEEVLPIETASKRVSPNLTKEA
jgi:hypothetical protein